MLNEGGRTKDYDDRNAHIQKESESNIEREGNIFKGVENGNSTACL